MDPEQKILSKKHVFLLSLQKLQNSIVNSVFTNKKSNRHFFYIDKYFERWGLLVETMRQPQRQKTDWKMIEI